MFLMIRTCIYKQEHDNLKLIFDALDEEKEGEIELEQFIEQMGAKFEIFINYKEMEQIIRMADIDFDGKV